ncbi:MAG: phytanoyl-CoA hydroxylase [Gammaproteobacteria bacterium]|jgi:phytanoyl-CoA hydroxylase
MDDVLKELAPAPFARDGYLLVRGLADRSLLAAMRDSVLRALNPLQAPAEFEAEVGYPGAPSARAADGGDTVRRLLHAYSRDEAFRRWASLPAMVEILQALMHGQPVSMSQCHHNCVMTKYPGFSSETMWHQDIRYWSFDAPELISVWLALDSEHKQNGALRVIPGSHRSHLDRGRLDMHLFLRPELEENQALIDSAVQVELQPGDALFFHCKLFHAADANTTDEVKLSTVLTYHARENQPIPGTRSAQYPSIDV